ncbi:DoxX family protein [Comamonas sp. JC664]|uniref:DoxX family protein n=1 Tax=Comamonas sp. JC664 TaxID=2801917 RepID=UPI00191E504E|nr:DoxX family protein [Comamonas sp. JC664]MBL0695696.1 DoxX family protein [Comamonas sp. JC664]GHG62984.1 membrane protein [Comamonas sp. KCTC 72670]
MSTVASSTPQAAVTTSKPWMLWLGRIFSGLVAALLAMSAVQKLNPSPEVLQGFQTFGYPAEVLLPIGVVELLCLIVYLVPRTSVLGAILITGYLGGATATHVRASDAFIVPILVGVVAWAGLFLRDARIRELLPLRR